MEKKEINDEFNAIKQIERAINNNLDGINYEELSNEDYALICNSMNVVNDIICKILHH